MIRVLAAAIVTLDCGCKVRSGNVACWYHHEREYGVAYPGCQDCRFNVPPVVHRCEKKG